MTISTKREDTTFLRERTSFARRRTGQEGSALLLALFSLVILTALALSVTAVTQTEMLLGTTERTLQRVFYAADSGIQIASARALVENDRRATTVTVREQPSDTGVDLRARLAISPVVPILLTHCNLCQVNAPGPYDSGAQYAVNHAVNVNAALTGPGGDVLAQRTVSSMLEYQPWNATIDVELDLDEVADIRF